MGPGRDGIVATDMTGKHPRGAAERQAARRGHAPFAPRLLDPPSRRRYDADAPRSVGLTLAHRATAAAPRRVRSSAVARPAPSSQPGCDGRLVRARRRVAAGAGRAAWGHAADEAGRAGPRLVRERHLDRERAGV